MHLGNSIICPVTGIPMLLLAGGAIYWAVRKSRNDYKKEDIFKIIALTMFVFALQMINFAIPQTGSSGHIVGAILLSILLGKYRAFISICTILTVQALFFNDGGLLALGCNIFNMGILACFVAYPLLYKPFENNKPIVGAILASVGALQLGSVFAVTEGIISGSISGNFGEFLSLMQFIHLPIGIIEGLFTAGIVAIVNKIGFTDKVSAAFGFVSLFLGGIIAQYASAKPDGLEWSLLKISDSVTAQTQGFIYSFVNAMQNKIAVLSGINPLIANILGLFIVAFLMVFVVKCLLVKRETVEE